MQILIVDDNRQIVSVLEEYAKKDGFDVITAFDGGDALEKALNNSFDIILLDVMMPVKDGFLVLREIRKYSVSPIIIITARAEDCIKGLDNGADDYIVKPFSPSEVMARIRAILRRISGPPKIVLGSLSINLEEHATWINGVKLELTKKETEILWTLAVNKNKVLSRDRLLDAVWGYDYFGDARTVDTHIKRLRAKLEDTEHSDWNIKTIWGIGYKFEI